MIHYLQICVKPLIQQLRRIFACQLAKNQYFYEPLMVLIV